MLPPVFQTLSASPAVTAIVGNRIYGHGMATQDAATPYIVWQAISIVPENSLTCTPDVDSIRVQIDAYTGEGNEPVARQLAAAVRDAVEPVASMQFAANGYETGSEAKPSVRLYRWTMDFIWHLKR